MCGQTSDTHKINLHFIWKELKSTFLKFDEGFIFTIKQLFTRPGHFIKEYLEGKRINRTKPVSFVLIVAGIYSFLYLYFDIKPAPSSPGAESSPIDSIKFNQWMFNNYAVVELMILPLFAIASYFAFRKYKYNFFEHLILNCYLLGQRTLANMLAFPFLIAFNASQKLVTITYITLLMNIGIVIWAFSQFFPKQPKMKIVFLTALTYAIVIVELLLIVYLYIWVKK